MFTHLTIVQASGKHQMLGIHVPDQFTDVTRCSERQACLSTKFHPHTLVSAWAQLLRESRCTKALRAGRCFIEAQTAQIDLISPICLKGA